MNNIKNKARRSSTREDWKELLKPDKPTGFCGIPGLIWASPEFVAQFDEAMKDEAKRMGITVDTPAKGVGVMTQADKVNPYQTLTVEKLKATIKEVFSDSKPRVSIIDKNGNFLW